MHPPPSGLACPQAGRCGGCPWITRPWDEQQDARRGALRRAAADAGITLPPDIPLHALAPGGVRDRADLSFRRTPDGTPTLGLWDVERGGLVPVGACPMASAALQPLLLALADDPLPLDRASLRARVAPDGAWGLWIDAANEDIKALLDQREWLLRWRDRATLELGQRRKPLAIDPDGRLRLLKHPELRPWFQTWLPTPQGLQPTPLFGPVGGFTQPGHAVNRLLVERVGALIDQTPARRWLELGAGQGNFTLPLAARADDVLAVEMDPTACLAIERAAEAAGLAERVDAVTANMHRHDGTLQALLASRDGLLVDPPRSGLLGTLDVLEALPDAQRPPTFLYISCYMESFVTDLARLTRLGWHLTHLEGVESFPQSPHAEWIGLLTRPPATPPAP